jgi:hypothetical protein
MAETDLRNDPRLRYDGRFYCSVHRDTALARLNGEGPLFCPLCQPPAPAEGGTDA